MTGDTSQGTTLGSADCDNPAVGAAGSEEDPAHHVLIGSEVCVVENLDTSTGCRRFAPLWRYRLRYEEGCRCEPSPSCRGGRVEIIDITAPAGPGSVMWPGQDAPSREFLSHTDRGAPSTVSLWRMSAHTGTHADARMHFIPGGWTMDSLKLSRCVGPCRVVDLTHVEGHVTRADLEAAEVAGTVRLLLKTRNSEDGLLDREGFVEDYVAIEREAAEYLVEIGVETVGVDYLSVEPFEDKEFNTHHTLLGADVIVVEGLVLAGVEPGEYFLACLPLKLVGSDGSPARAILIRGL